MRYVSSPASYRREADRVRYGFRTKPGKKGKRSRKVYKAEYINSYDIPSDTLHLGTTDLGRTFGIVDMYKDDSDLSDVHRVEKAFSKLESAAALVIEKMCAAEARDRASVVLVRSELNTLRKFLFLIHYRNGGHAQQFLESRFDVQTAAMVEAYRAQHGLRDAREVWLRNLALLLEDEHWEVSYDERLLWTTREDYKLNAQSKQFAIYRAPPGVDFILTENGLGLWEGSFFPAHVLAMHPRGTNQGGTHFDWSTVFAVSPRLVVVLRSALLTMEAMMLRNGVAAAEASAHLRMFANPSYFADLPRTPPVTRYYPPFSPDAWSFKNYASGADMPVQERKKFEDFTQRNKVDGMPLTSRVRDVFEFTIDSMTTDQAERVNVLMLTHCRQTISFLSPAGLLRSVAAFEKDMTLSRPPNKRSYRALKYHLHLAIEMANAPPATDVAPAPVDKVPAPASNAAGPSVGSHDPTSSERNVPRPTCIHSPNTERAHASVSPLHTAALASPNVSVPPRDSNDSGRRAMPDGLSAKGSLPGLRGAFKRKPPRTESPSLPPSATYSPAWSGGDVESALVASTPVSPRACKAAESTPTPPPEPKSCVRQPAPATQLQVNDARDSNDSRQRVMSAGLSAKETLPGLRGAFKRKPPRVESPSLPPSAICSPGRDVEPPAVDSISASPRTCKAAESMQTFPAEPEPRTRPENEPALPAQVHGNDGAWRRHPPSASIVTVTTPGHSAHPPDAAHTHASAGAQPLQRAPIAFRTPTVSPPFCDADGGGRRATPSAKDTLPGRNLSRADQDEPGPRVRLESERGDDGDWPSADSLFGEPGAEADVVIKLWQRVRGWVLF
jgi:hypothetical protein